MRVRIDQCIDGPEAGPLGLTNLEPSPKTISLPTEPDCTRVRLKIIDGRRGRLTGASNRDGM